MTNFKKLLLYSIGLLSIVLMVFTLLQRDARYQTHIVVNEQSVDPTTPPEVLVEEFATGFEVPWSIVWTSPARALVTERPGRLRVIENGVLLEETLHIFDEVVSVSEAGLMGLALDPNYEKNKYIYVTFTYHDDAGNLKLKYVCYRDQGDHLTTERILLDNIPAARFHAGSRLAVGPDNMMYMTTGDATNKNLPQDINSLAGKILRMKPNGKVPGDNPLRGNLVYSYGHRNSQGLDWHPVTQELYATEHGPSLFDGPPGGDEINRIAAAGNYGWPLVSHNRSTKEAIDPLVVFTPAEAPGSGMFYHGTTIPEFQNNFFFGALRGEGIVRVVLDPKHPGSVMYTEKLFGSEYGRIRTVAQGPDGYLYFMTSNRDGRGDKDKFPSDKIYRVRPAESLPTALSDR